ncbi:hypothetical protein ACJ73_07121 [Blastomyces percursus]|uniref:Uncharacterized protein n=1 Tax=Blastomyces percursus TaxID=1658174 RepID=A0A1J9R0H0_9EURO|nr:hypothetical protein ACJ73_07121 [Blastomyces percursus]
MFNWHTSVEHPPQGNPVSARQQHQLPHQQHQQHQHQPHPHQQHPHQHQHQRQHQQHQQHQQQQQQQQHQQQQQNHHGPPLQWLTAAPPLSRPLPNTLPPLSAALCPPNNFGSTTQNDPAVLHTPASTDHSLSESSSIRENTVVENAVDLDPEPTYDHPAPGPEPSSDEVEIDGGGGSAPQQASRVGPGRGVDITLLENETPRKHGKRLTTREETALFEICNRHAATFGERNRLCEWWVNVTQEFTASEGHPYSWHSVRRKVELVTQQRIKFLAGLDGKRRDDQADAAWSAAVDSWIPAWKRFQEQETERINAKQGKRGRKRKAVVDAEGVGLGYQHMLPPGFDTMFPPSSKPSKATRMDPPASIPAATAPSSTTAESVQADPPSKQQKQQQKHQQKQQQQQKQQKQQQKQQHVPASIPIQPTSQQTAVSNTAAILAAGTSSSASSAAAVAAAEPNVGAAILETLSKLNKNLEAVSSRTHQSNAMSLAAAAAHPHPHSHPHPHQHQHQHQQQKSSPNPTMANHGRTAAGAGGATAAAVATGPMPVQNSISPSTLHQLKSELRAELRQEIQKDRAQLEEKLDSVQRTQEMILELLRQEPQ